MMTSTPRRHVLATLIAAALAPAAFAQATPYPAKPVTFIVPFAAGTATDQLARALGQSITADTKQTVVVDNKAGASGMLAAQAAARAAPDGYTVLITTNTTHAANEHLYKKLPYDAVKDFAPVTGLGKGGQVLVVPANSPYKSVAELLEFARKNPGKLSFGSGSSSSRVAGELLQQMSGTQILHVPYKSNTLAITDLMGGQINLMVTDTSTGVPQIKAGKVRALGVSTTKRLPMLPDVPTIDEAGVPGLYLPFWHGLWVPKGTPRGVVAKLNSAVVETLADPAMQKRLTGLGVEIQPRNQQTPEALRAFLKGELDKWRPIIAAAKIKPGQ